VSRAGPLFDRLTDATLVHVDARVLALHLIGESRFLPLTRRLVAAIRDGEVRAQTSVMTLYQLLAEVYRRGERERAREVARSLMVHEGLQLVPATDEIAVQAAQVRAQLGGRPERAIQIATALVAGADVYVTEGSGLRRIVGMTVANLEDYAEAPESPPDPPAVEGDAPPR